MRVAKCFVIFCAINISLLVNASESTFAGLENIVGVWKLSTANSEREKSFQLNYHLISQNSALVEVYGDPAKQTTETIFHRDGKKLLATHYCARGNQPRLKASKIEKNRIEFIFQDITNLTNKNDAHMVRMNYTFIDKDHFQKEEVYLVDGKEESSTLSLTRIDTNI